MNKFFISSFKHSLTNRNNFYAIKYFNFARSVHKPSINKMMNQLSEKLENPQSNTIDMDKLYQFENTLKEQLGKENFNIPNMDQAFEKDQNFSQKEKHDANFKKSEKSETKDETEDTGVTQSKE